MAHTRAIEGFEDGSGSGVTSVAARSGAFGWNCEAVAGVGELTRSVGPNTHPAISGDGTLFDVKGVTYLNLQAYPSASGVTVAGLKDATSGVEFVRVEMNTSGQPRLTTSIGGSVWIAYTSAYGSALVLSRQYKVELRFYGHVMTVGSAGRAKATVRITDDETGVQIFYGETPTQLAVTTTAPSFIRALNGTTIEHRMGVGESGITAGWTTLATLVSGLFTNVTATTGVLGVNAGVGTYNTVTGQSTITRAEVNGHSTIISNTVTTFDEQGTYTVFGESAGNFQQLKLGASGLTNLVLFLGQPASTPTHSRHQWYDDCYLEIRSGVDVTGSAAFPSATHIYGFVPTGQGPDDGFAPAGAWQRVDEIPPGADVGGDEISSSTNGATSTYTHAALVDSTSLVHHVRVKMNGASPAFGTHAAIVNNVAYSFAVPTVLTTKYADPIFTTPITAAAFATLTFGVRNTQGGDAFRVNQVMLEALCTRTQPTGSIYPDRGPMVGGNTVTLNGVGFVSGATVKFNGVPGTGVVVLGPTQLTVLAPASATAGRVDVEISVPQLYPATLISAYKYLVNFFLRSRRENNPISITDVLNDAPNTCSFTVHDRDAYPQPKQEVQIIDRHGNLLFGGHIQTTGQTHEELPTNMRWDATAVDYVDELNRFRPYGTWDKKSATEVVQDLFDQFAPGFTTDFLQEDLPIITISCSRSELLGTVLSRICKLINGFWTVDYYKRLKLGRKAIGKYAPPGPKSSPVMTRTTNLGPSFPNWSMYSAKEQYKSSFVFEDGTESVGSPASPTYLLEVADSTQGAVKQMHFANIETGPSGVIARRVRTAVTGVNNYKTTGATPGVLPTSHPFPIALADFPEPSWEEKDSISFNGVFGNGDFYVGEFVFSTIGANNYYLSDNTSTTMDRWDPDPAHGIGIPGAKSPFEPHFEWSPAAPEDYIPSPTDPEPPDILDANCTTLLSAPSPLLFTLDGTSIRTRLYIKGASTKLTHTVHAGDYYYPLEDMSLVPSAGRAQIVIGNYILTTQFTSLLEGSQAAIFNETLIPVVVGVPGEAHPTFEAGTQVSLYLQYDDIKLQKELAAIIDDSGMTQPGVYEGWLSGDWRTTDEMITAAKSDLNMFGRAVQGVEYYTLDTKTKSGKTVIVDLPFNVDNLGIFDPNIFDPNIFDCVSTLGVFGEFLIQSVQVTDIDINDTFVARYHVTASPVRFTFYDLVQRVLIDTSH